MPKANSTTPRKIKIAKFIEEYMTDFNGTRAAIAAGYSEKGAGVVASNLLKDANVLKAIKKHRIKNEKDFEKKMEMLGLTKQRMAQELMLVAFADMNNFATVDDRDNVNLISTKKRKPKLGKVIKKLSQSVSMNGGSSAIELHSKDRAMELLAKLMGWTKEQVALTLPEGGMKVNLNMPDNGYTAGQQPQTDTSTKDEGKGDGSSSNT